MKKKSLLEKLLYREQILEKTIRECEDKAQKERLRVRLAELRLVIVYVENE